MNFSMLIKFFKLIISNLKKSSMELFPYTCRWVADTWQYSQNLICVKTTLKKKNKVGGFTLFT